MDSEKACSYTNSVIVQFAGVTLQNQTYLVSRHLVWENTLFLLNINTNIPVQVDHYFHNII